MPYALPRSKLEVLSTIFEVSSLTSRLQDVRLNLLQGKMEYTLDFDKPLKFELLEVCLDGDVVVGRFYIGRKTVLICITSRSSGGGHGSTIQIFEEW